MGRAQATAAPTAKALGLPVTIEKWTRELTDWPNLPGSSDALRLWDVGGSDVRCEDDLSVKNQWTYAPMSQVPEVQNRYAELCAASDNFIETLGYRREGGRYQAIKPNRDIIAVFCHGGFGGAWISHLLGIPLAAAWSSFYLAPSSVTTILFDERGADKVAPRAIGVGDLAHLFAEGLTTPNSKYEKQNKFSDKPRPSGIRANFF